MALIDLRGISKIYHSGEIAVPVLQNVSLTIAHGEFTALMGASGSGKTTLMNILGCLDRPSGGQHWLEGREVGQLSLDERAWLRMHRIGFVFQTFNLLARTSALENVMLPLSYSAEHRSDARQRAQALLERMGLADRAHHEPARLSGGQQQRVAIARALINRPALVLADEPTGNLDSNTSDDVLRIFQRLNEEEGVTIILVTHETAVARYARRVIRIRDGRIEAEGPGAASPETQVVLARSTISRREDRSGAGEPAGRLRGALHTAVSGLKRNVLRAALTTLGIVIGVSAVIAMMELGRGSQSAIQQSIASLGANNLLVLPGTAASGGVSFGAGTVLTLTPEDSEAIARQSSAVRAVAPIVRARTQVIYRDRNWVPIYIYGTTPAYLDIREWSLAEGDPFTERDVRNASKVCVIGQRLVRELFQGGSPLEQEIRVENVSFKVIGVLSRKGANMMGIDQDDILLAPWTTIKFRVTGSSLANPNQSASATAASGSGASQPANTLSRLYPNVESDLYPPPADQGNGTPRPVRFINVDQISVAARSTEQVPVAIEEITEILRERHRIHGDEPDDFNVRDMAEMTKALSTTTDMVTKLLLAVALISLIVGGVGIMNIMLVSVTERTREIGLRMAVGARRRNILQQFLLESVLLCFCGGIAGILLGRLVSHLITAVLQWPTELSLDAIIAAFAVSVTVGIVFGYYPAWKASRLDPITALRYE
jgi:macrolide transport system ATP-binding/permease protein